MKPFEYRQLSLIHAVFNLHFLLKMRCTYRRYPRNMFYLLVYLELAFLSPCYGNNISVALHCFGVILQSY